MAGTIIADKIQTENAFLTLNVGQTLVATINSSGILNSSGGTMVGANGSVSNTAITGFINGSQLAANTVANSNIQTGAVENYLNAQNYSTGMRNRLINGGFDIWQRATTGATGYVADRWYMENSGTITRTTDVPSGNVGFTYSANVTVTSATSYGVIKQRIESTNTKDLPGQYVTLSFWAKTTQGDTTLYANLYYGDDVDTYNSVTQIATSSVATSSSWRKYSITYGPMPTQVNRGLQVYFFSADASTAPIYYITGIQLEKGSQATPFEFRQYGTELQLCRRYTWVTNSDSINSGIGKGSAAAWCSISIPVQMRTSPTVTVTGNLCLSDEVSYDAISTSPTVVNSNLSNVGGRIEIGGWPTSLTSYRVFHGTSAGGSGTITLNAEL